VGLDPPFSILSLAKAKFVSGKNTLASGENTLTLAEARFAEGKTNLDLAKVTFVLVEVNFVLGKDTFVLAEKVLTLAKTRFAAGFARPFKAFARTLEGLTQLSFALILLHLGRKSAFRVEFAVNLTLARA
jgi:hypothetical protein